MKRFPTEVMYPDTGEIDLAPEWSVLEDEECDECSYEGKLFVYDDGVERELLCSECCGARAWEAQGGLIH